MGPEKGNVEFQSQKNLSDPGLGGIEPKRFQGPALGSKPLNPAERFVLQPVVLLF